MISEEQKLYDLCRSGRNVKDCEKYFMSFPDGEHIDHIRGWYQGLLTDYLNEFPAIEKVKQCSTYRLLLDGFRKNDSNHGNYWSDLISRISAIAENARIEYVKELKANKGKKPARKYAEMFDESVLKDTDYINIGLSKEEVGILGNIFGPRKIDIEPLEKERYENKEYKLPNNCTEIYFWGLPASGKSCCLSAILSTASHEGYCGGYDAGISGNTYFELLTNIFHYSKNEDGSSSDNLCVLVSGTNTNSIASASYKMNHPKLGTRKMCLIDLAGETFKSMHKVNNKQDIGDDELSLCLDVTTDYLMDTRNRKLHFFVVPYCEREVADRDGFTTSQYLQACAQYLENKKIIKNTTDGIFIVVTKADLMGCPPEQYAQEASAYIHKKYKSFITSMEKICSNNGIGTSSKRVEILPFSIGEMVALDTCKFSASGAERFIDLLCEKSYKELSRFGKFIDCVFKF